MGIEKQWSKGGGSYAGGFFQLFDWNGKARKKLFSSKSDLPDGSNQEKTDNEKFPVTQLQANEEDDNGRLSIKGSSPYSCSSSVTDEEGNGTKAPGVVARLMGLDSLPTSSITEPYSTPFVSSRSLHEGPYKRKPEFHHEQQNMYTRSQSNRSDDFSWNSIDSKLQKTLNKPIQRFQTEILPPKSAKSIPITHHKLLSPIRSPRFIQSKNAAQIMEEAAKIIELGPQASVKRKIRPVRSSSVPAKFQNVKKKIEAAQGPSSLNESSQRTVDSEAAKYLKGKSLSKSWSGVDDENVFTASPNVGESNSPLFKHNKKSISLAVQAKVNVQRREGLSSSANKNLLDKKEQIDLQVNQPFRNQPGIQKNVQKKSSNQNASMVLRQNNQKQNRLTNRDKATSKQPVSNQQGKRSMSDGALVQNKTSKKVAMSSKVGSRKVSVDNNDITKEVAFSKVKNFAQKKRSVDGNFHEKRKDVLIGKKKKANQTNVAIDGGMKWEGDDKRKGMDVVSFTFTSPLAKSMSVSQCGPLLMGEHSKLHVNSCFENFPADVKRMKSPCFGLNVIGGDALNTLLEQKLWELTHAAEPSCSKSVKSGSGASSPSVPRDLTSDLNSLSTTSEEYDDKPLHELGNTCYSNCTSTADFMLEEVEDLGDYGRKSVGRIEVDCPNPSPVSILEPSFSIESCNSSDGSDWNSVNQYSSVQAREIISSINHPVKLSSKEADTELYDSASSFTEDLYGNDAKPSNMETSPTHLDNWELEYMREILCNSQLLFDDFTLNQSNQIMNPCIFDELENRLTRSITDSEEKSCWSISRRKLLFDYVGECLEFRCHRYGNTGYKGWEKGTKMVNKGWLAEEVYKEISGWRRIMDDSLLDELVDKDMSSQFGRWLDFEPEAFELGIEVARRILSSLVSEVVKDFLSI